MQVYEPIEIEEDLIARLREKLPELPVFPFHKNDAESYMPPAGVGALALVVYVGETYDEATAAGQARRPTVLVLIGAQSLRAKEDGRHRGCLGWLPAIRAALTNHISRDADDERYPLKWKPGTAGFRTQDKNGTFWYEITFTAKDYYTGG